MRLRPPDIAATAETSGDWHENPGFPPSEGSWIRPTTRGLPEYWLQEDHEKTRNGPPPRISIGSHDDAHVKVEDERVASRHCVVFKEGRHWFVEGVSTQRPMRLGDVQLEPGVAYQLRSGDVFSLDALGSALQYLVEFDDADNWYLDVVSDKDFPNRWPAKMPGHPTEAPEAPEELKRLAWQTDQMRRRSEEDQVLVADWAAFSQYVKKHYHKYGIFAEPWQGSLGPAPPRPPKPAPRPWPKWVAELVAEEQMLPHVDRELPFLELLELSGAAPRRPLGPRAPRPRGPVSAWGAADRGRYKSGGTGRMVGDASLQALGLTPLSSTDTTLQGSAASSAAPQPRLPEAAAEAPPRCSLPMPESFKSWLQSMEDAQFVLPYHDALTSQFDSLEQILTLFVHGGEVDDRFFESIGIHKLGHRRIFQKWFREHCK